MRRAWVLAFALSALLAGCSGESIQAPATVTPGATPVETLGRAPVLERVASPLRKSTHASGALLDVEQGVAFIATRDGSVELWSTAAQVDPNTAHLQASHDGRLLVFYEGGDPRHTWIVRRDTGEAFEVKGGWMPDVTVGYENIIGAWQGTDSAEFALLDVASQTFIPTTLSRSFLRDSSRVSSPDGRTFVLGDGSDFHLVDATTGKGTTLKQGLTGYRASALEFGRGFRLAPTEPASDPVFAFDWSGNALPPPPANGASPDGSLRAEQQSPGSIQGFGLGGFPVIGAVTLVRGTTNTPVARYLGASFAGWAADSKVLKLGDDTGGVTIVGIDGRIWTRLPYPGLTQGGPSFSPVDASLIATNLGFMNFRTGQSWTVRLRDQMSSSTAWSVDGAELVMYMAPTGGKDGGVAQQLFDLKFETAPFDQTLRLAVKTGGDCLNLREGATVDAAIVRCLPDGAVLTPQSILLPNLNPKEDPREWIGRRTDDGRIWLHVRASDGAAGWVDSAFLDWAP